MRAGEHPDPVGWKVKLGDLYATADQSIRDMQLPTERSACMIQYAHETGGVFYNGTISNLNGPVIATWSYDLGPTRATKDRMIDPGTLAWLRRGIELLPVIRNGLCYEMGRDVDPAEHHIVTLIVSENGEVGRSIYLVPAVPWDAEFQLWLLGLKRPDQPPSEDERAAAVWSMEDMVRELATQVLADTRWKDQHDDLGVEVFAALLYGFGLNVAAHRMFVGTDDVGASVTHVLTEQAGVPSRWADGFVRSAWSAIASRDRHYRHHALIQAGMGYFLLGSTPHWPAIVDDVFAQISQVRGRVTDDPGN
jgi:hypothetical protein